jgi:hypothetical protein
MSVQDRLRDRLQSCALTNNLIAPGHLSAQATRVLIRNPDLRQEATRVHRADTLASITSVLNRASAISLTWRGLAITTRPTYGRITSTTALALPVASP